MILYHGTNNECAKNIVISGHAENGYKNDPNDYDCIWATNNIEMAKSYGDCIIAIEVNEHDPLIESYPIFSGACEFVENWMNDAIEFRIPIEVNFKASIIK